MPKTKKLEDSSDSDSGPEDRNPPKKSKTDSPAKSSSSSSKSKSGGGGDGGGGGEDSWELDKRRAVRINAFKGRVFVDIREFYDDKGELKPGKKGISLSMEQYRKLKEAIPKIDEALKNY